MSMQRELVDERVGEAWRLHRSDDNSAAVDLFSDLTRDTPRELGDNELTNISATERDARLAEWVNYIDGLYGYGLSIRKENQEEQAVEIFREALSQTDKVLRALGVSNLQTGANELDSFADDRFVMLRRMIEQRLQELGANPAG